MNKQQHREWRICVLGCELTDTQRLVLLALETFAFYPAGTNARPGTELLAEMCRCDRHTAGEALTAGVKAGLIEQTARQVPKAHRAAVYRLLPQPVSRAAAAAVEHPVSMAGSDVSMAGSTVSMAGSDVSMAAAAAITNPYTPNQLHQSKDTSPPVNADALTSPKGDDDEIIDAEFTEIEDLSDVRSKAVKDIPLCATPGCGQPSDVWNSIEGDEYCDDCYARLRTRR
jgi:hypothetical protein